MASLKHEPIMGVQGQSPQWDPGPQGQSLMGGGGLLKLNVFFVYFSRLGTFVFGRLRNIRLLLLLVLLFSYKEDQKVKDLSKKLSAVSIC